MLVQVEEVKPRNRLVGLGEKVDEAAVDLEIGAQIGPEEGEEFESLQAAQRRYGIVLGEDQFEFVKKPGLGGEAEQVHPHRVSDQLLGVAGDFEIEPSLEAHRPENAGRVLDEA